MDEVRNERAAAHRRSAWLQLQPQPRQRRMIYSRIAGTGSYLPPRVMTNDEFAARLDTSDAWIRERTGIAQRHIADESQASSDLALRGEPRARCRPPACSADELDLIVVATSTPDYIFPSTACLLQAKLGVKGCAAFDVQAVCSGFVYALATADSFIRTGMYKNALVVGAEVFSRILDWNDRGTCVLFGDGAGAVVLDRGREARHPRQRAARRRQPGRHAFGAGQRLRRRDHRLAVPADERAGRVQVRGARCSTKSARETVAAAGMTLADVDWLIPHQANVRILEATARKLGLPPREAGGDGRPSRQHLGGLGAARARRVRARRARSAPATACCCRASAAASPGARRSSRYETRDGISGAGLAGGRHAEGLCRPARGRGSPRRSERGARRRISCGCSTKGPAEQLNLTVNTQPAMVTAGYAAYRAWRALGGPQPAIVAGHSLGEYTALVAAGALDVRATACRWCAFARRRCRKRCRKGRARWRRSSASTTTLVRAACAEAGGEVQAVNFNAPGQVVIAGEKAAVARAIEACKAKGAKRAMPLPVSAPFHSS